MADFEFYVLRYDISSNKAEMFNIFRNHRLNEDCLNAVKDYKAGVFTFEEFKEIVLSAIRWQEWARVQYECSVGPPFYDENTKFEKWDCYEQCVPNIDTICREIIYQFGEEK